MAYQSGWEKLNGAMAAQVYARGERPPGLMLPPRSRSGNMQYCKAGSSKRHDVALDDVAEWDHDCATDHLFPKPQPMLFLPRLPLLMQVWMTPVSDERSTEPDSND